MDLARFMFPYWWIPKRWVSSLFEHNAGRPTKTVCSVMMAEAFASVHFPIRPVLHQDDSGTLKMYRRHTRLITPSDYDYSPYFEIIKYPILDLDDLALYRKLPWDRTGVHTSDIGDGIIVEKSNMNLVDTGYTESDDAVVEIHNSGNDNPGASSDDDDETVKTLQDLKEQQNN
jgi:hypothetical protein